MYKRQIYNPTTHNVVESRNVIFVETPSQRDSPPGGYYYECEGPVLGNDTTMTNDNLLRDVRDLTQRLNFNTS